MTGFMDNKGEGILQELSHSCQPVQPDFLDKESIFSDFTTFPWTMIFLMIINKMNNSQKSFYILYINVSVYLAVL